VWNSYDSQGCLKPVFRRHSELGHWFGVKPSKAEVKCRRDVDPKPELSGRKKRRDNSGYVDLQLARGVDKRGKVNLRRYTYNLSKGSVKKGVISTL